MRSAKILVVDDLEFGFSLGERLRDMDNANGFVLDVRWASNKLEFDQEMDEAERGDPFDAGIFDLWVLPASHLRRERMAISDDIDVREIDIVQWIGGVKDFSANVRNLAFVSATSKLDRFDQGDEISDTELGNALLKYGKETLKVDHCVALAKDDNNFDEVLWDWLREATD